MACPVCPQKLTRDMYVFINGACAACQQQLKQMMAGFHGVVAESRPQRTVWNNTEAFEEWKSKLSPEDSAAVQLQKNKDYVSQRCDVRDMKRIVGLPKFLPLEHQVFTAWVLEGQKDERIQEVLGLTYSQLFAIKNIVKKRLQKQMGYYRQVKKLAEEKDVK